MAISYIPFSLISILLFSIFLAITLSSVIIEFIEKQEDFDTMFSDVEDYYKLNYNNKIYGLFNVIGNYKNNVILSVGALNLLDKLFDTEYNPDAELYINHIRQHLEDFDNWFKRKPDRNYRHKKTDEEN